MGLLSYIGDKLYSNSKEVALADDANDGLGVNQTWQNMLASRSFNITYTNDTGKPIQVSIVLKGGSSSADTRITLYIIIDEIEIVAVSGYNYPTVSAIAIIPTGSTYRAEKSGDTTGVSENWFELRGA